MKNQLICNFNKWYTLLGLTIMLNGCITSKKTVKNTDTTPPRFAFFPKDLEIYQGKEADFGTPIAIDDKGPTHLAFVDQKKDNPSGSQTIIRTWSALDTNGNQTTRQQTITIGPNNTFAKKDPATLPIYDDKLHLLLDTTQQILHLRFRMERSGQIKSTIYDLSGKTMTTLEKELPPGSQSEQINVSQYPSGTYIVMMTHNGKWLSGQFVKNKIDYK